MHFVFVHGWGFSATLWRGVVGLLRTSEVTLVDLGFIAGGAPQANIWPKDAIAVGHSLGLLWLLHRAGDAGSVSFRALVSIQGFDRFCPTIPASRVAGMRRALRRDAAAIRLRVVHRARRQCGSLRAHARAAHCGAGALTLTSGTS